MTPGASLLLLLGSLAACGGPDSPSPAAVVRLDEARLAALNDPSAGIDGAPAAADLRLELTDAATFDGFLESCRVEQAAASADMTGATSKGTIYQGETPIPLTPLPKDNIFRWVVDNPEYLDPNLISESAGSSIVINLFETLYVTAPDNSPPRPGAALSHTVSEDGLTWTFKIRKDMRWSDGVPFNAHDFVYSWRRGLNPLTASKNAQLLWFIRGAAEYNAGTNADPDSVAVSAPDAETLVVGLVGPTPFFNDLVTYTAFAPVPRHAIEKFGGDWTRPANIVTNGPFLLAEWIERDRFVLKKNPDFWDAASVKLDGSVIYHSSDERRNEVLYESGQIHMAAPLSQDSVPKWIQSGRSDLRIDLNMCIYYYSMRMDRPPFNDARVRRAFNLSLDKERLTRHILGSFQTVATTLVPGMVEAFSGYRPPPGPGYDPVRAVELLTAAGYPRGRGLQGLEISYNTSEGHKRVAEFAGRNWIEKLGVEITSANMEWKSLLKKHAAGDFQITRTAWCADYPDAATFLGVFHSKSESNYPAYKNPAFDAMLDRSGVEVDRAERNAILCAAEKGLLADMPIVPIYQYTRSTLIRPEVKGYDAQYQDQHLLRWLSLELPEAAPKP